MGHINTQAENLNGLGAGDWQPDLDALDAVIASLQIEGMVSSGIQEKTWAWTGRGALEGEAAPVENPTQYTITYNSDGTFSYQADCNSGGGGYSFVGGFNGDIQHALGPATLSACPPESRADEFLGAIAAASEFRILPGGIQMQFPLAASDDAMILTDAQYISVDIPEPDPGVPTATVAVPEGVFVRTGPGTNYPSLGVAPFGESGTIVGRSEDGQWWVIDAPNVPAGQVWVSAAFVQVQNGDNVPVVAAPALPTPVPTPTAPPPPSPTISFTADSTQINQGDCTTLRWDVESIQAIWVYPAGSNYQNYPKTGQGSEQVCPEQTTTYEMRVLHIDGTTEIRSITIQVRQGNALAGTSWALTSLNVNQVLLPGSTLTLQFVDGSSANANGGCNNYSGTYAVYFSGISIGPLAGTKLSCGTEIDTQESVYIQALESATTFAVSGDVLVLYGAGNVEVARFSALRAVPLSGG
jgi:heat shock protein HslJ